VIAKWRQSESSRRFLSFVLSTVMAENAVSQIYVVEKQRINLIAISCKFGYSLFILIQNFKLLIELKLFSGHLSNDNSVSYDEISMKVLKISTPYISSPLCRIINTSLNSGVFPTRLKYSVITPLHKKGDKSKVTNYRPFSLLTSFSKIFGKVIYNRLITHFTSNNIFTNSQFGFRKKSSTDNAAYTLINGILLALNNKRIVGGIFFDLEKAFDCVNHDFLLAKIEYYGIRDVMYTLIKSYLENRHQRVKFNKKFSKWDKINIGVPQGSIWDRCSFQFILMTYHL